MNEKLVLRTSLRQAVIGEVSDNMVAITGGVSNFVVTIRAYFKEPITDNDKECVSVITTQVISDFSEQYTFREEILILNADEGPKVLDCWGFLRQTTPHT